MIVQPHRRGRTLHGIPFQPVAFGKDGQRECAHRADQVHRGQPECAMRTQAVHGRWGGIAWGVCRRQARFHRRPPRLLCRRRAVPAARPLPRGCSADASQVRDDTHGAPHAGWGGGRANLRPRARDIERAAFWRAADVSTSGTQPRSRQPQRRHLTVRASPHARGSHPSGCAAVWWRGGCLRVQPRQAHDAHSVR